jgi:hypothetical protein
MKYDDVSWHSEGDFPEDLPYEAAATYIGMYLVWALLAGLGGRHFVEDFPGEMAQLRARTVTPGRFLLCACDGTLMSDDLSAEGDAFTRDYFPKDGQYLADYMAAFSVDAPAIYRVADTWENFGRLQPVMDQRLADWRQRTAAI